MTEAQYDALVKKLMAAIRSSVSCASTPSQSFILKGYKAGNIEAEKKEFRKILERRYAIVRKFVNEHKSQSIRQRRANPLAASILDAEKA